MHPAGSTNTTASIILGQVTRAKSKSDAVVKHQRVFVVLKTTSNAKWLFKSGAAPLYRSLVTLFTGVCGCDNRCRRQESRLE